ncbi:MAG: shikimate dehydrogenase [Deltaproteobacteria bacterium]|nr:MAG: shikimate dehydrogenase [Deltaproteobacteria bacterium]
MINSDTRLFGIIGNPVKHSMSPAMHNRAFAALGLNCVYLPFCTADAEHAVKGMKALGIEGLSVTIPYKQQVMAWLDDIEPNAEKIGAVNTIQLKNGRLHGSNTDWLGASLALSAQINLHGKTVVILGAGGSARAIGFGLLKQGASVKICSRTESSGRKLADLLACRWEPLTAANSAKADILVNATPVGMAPEDSLMPINSSSLKNYAAVMDIVYSPLQTRLLQEAEKAGCKTINGLEMLLYQGAAQFELWTEKPAPIEVMREALLEKTTAIYLDL